MKKRRHFSKEKLQDLLPAGVYSYKSEINCLNLEKGESNEKPISKISRK